jgi:phosphoribosylanthranilate isomerase
MTRMRIKFCGITRSEDAQCAVVLGVDALGFVFTRRSKRFIEPAAAATIVRPLPPFVSRVALFMDDDPAWISQVISIVRPDVLQFHGEEPASLCESFGRPYLKAVAMASVADVGSYAAGFERASGFLLDAHAAGQQGGSGECFDWSRMPQLEKPLILAGGLDATNVGEAIQMTRPYAVDVSSGIEIAPGIKDPRRMQEFVAAVRATTID